MNTTTQSRRKQHLRVSVILIVALVLCSAFGSLVSISLSQLQISGWALARTEGRNLTAALAREVARTVESFDISLQAAAENITLPGFEDANPEMRRAAVFTRSANARGISTILVLDAAGNVLMSSREDRPQRPNYADRSYFAQHRDNTNLGLYIGPPLQSRMSAGWFITLSRRIPSADGSFKGVVVGALDVSAWRTLFESMEIGSNSRITLLRRDGTLLLRTPFNESELGRSVRSGRAFQPMQTAQQGQFTEVATSDGVERLYTFQHIDGAPLILNTALATMDVELRWQSQARLVVSLGVFCGGLVLCIGVALFWEFRRRRKIEIALNKANEELRLIASTDALTGLSNRRAFDERLAMEWKREGRAGHSLALLILDVDHFKKFNDTFGHPAGDTCLQEVSRALRSVARRPGDVLARVGGEEFALLMPETNEDGARHMARSVGEAVEALGIEHPANAPFGIVTVSIGGTSMKPNPGRANELNELLKAADRALYMAKETGRNRLSWFVNGGVILERPAE